MNHRAVLAAAALTTIPAAARADRRYYGETYNALIAPTGALDVELWATQHRAPREGGTQFWDYQLELETGLTDHWDIALYNLFLQEQGGPFQYQGVKLETRYRLADPGLWPVDVVLYFEARKEVIEDKPFAVEEKLIVAHDFGDLNVSANLIAEQEFIPAGGGREYEWAYAVGASYELHPIVRVGAEAFGGLTHTTLGENIHESYVGPALSLAWARSWLVLAAGLGLTDQSERARLRAVLAFQF